MVNDTPFSPDWVSPPGATIATILEELGATPSELARGSNGRRTTSRACLSAARRLPPT